MPDIIANFTKNKSMRTLFLTLTLLLTFFSFSQTPAAPVSWSATYTQLSGNEGEIVFTARIDPKWHIYSQRPTDAGPIPTSFSITPAPGIQLLGAVEETGAHEEYVPAFEAKVFVFEKEAVFRQKIRRSSTASQHIGSSVEYMTCNDRQCLPPKTVELSIDLPARK